MINQKILYEEIIDKDYDIEEFLEYLETQT